MFSKLAKKEGSSTNSKTFLFWREIKILWKQKHKNKTTKKTNDNPQPKTSFSTRYKECESLPQNGEEFFCWGIDSKLAQPRVKNHLKKNYWNEVEKKLLSATRNNQTSG
jgi:hypothetical protein